MNEAGEGSMDGSGSFLLSFKGSRVWSLGPRTYEPVVITMVRLPCKAQCRNCQHQACGIHVPAVYRRQALRSKRIALALPVAACSPVTACPVLLAAGSRRSRLFGSGF